MKLTLIQPSIGKFQNAKYVKTWQMQPLAIAVLAGLTPKDISITFYDDRLDDIPYDEATDLVAIPVETYTAKRAYTIAAEFRKRQIPVVMGGIQAALIPEEVIAHADAVVIGDAEKAWEQVLFDARNKQLKKVYQMTTAIRQPLQHIIPRRDLFAGKKYIPLEMVETGRGCPFTCDFCAIAGAHSGNYRSKYLDNIVADIASLKGNLVYFVDDNFVSNFKRTKELCAALAPLKKRWFSHGSINMAYDEKLLTLLERSGCTNILIGFESLNEANLAAMGKSWNKVKYGYSEAIKRLRDHGISIYGTFVFGYDHDTLDDFETTLEFAIEQKFALAAFNHLIPFPGTPLYDRLKKEERLFEEKWWLRSGYRFGEVAFKPKNMSAEILAEKCFECRMKFYNYSSVFKRMFDTKANCKSLMNSLIFLSANLTSQKGIKQRQHWPIGDVIE